MKTLATLQLRGIELRVADLARSVDFYVRQLGLVALRQGAGRAEIAAFAGGPVLLTLTEDRTAAPAPADAAGLFHAALLLPDRGALGRWLRHAAEVGVQFDGFSDHGVSEAIYLADPDGNGLEFYSDRPREAWPMENGQIAMYTRGMDVPSVLAAGANSPATPPLAGAHWGHLHLRVTHLERSAKFYRSTLGLETMQDSFAGALFLAANGYHHHVGLNTWGRPRLPQPTGALGLVSATFARSEAPAETDCRDPDGMALRLVPA